ncbi:MAG: biotin/lipoyl-binding protein [Bacteroidetes bacterium]|nr:biotin/lipoyl-binding protein [Bacteroidota bacterium]MBL0066034.1 biotin/lipoyl-binding protein [Bacteroidota bacterium]MBL0138102.1 biotin/lipoyl-binding protein [Bacteroidota bacterium]
MYKVLVNNQEFKVEYDSTHQSINGQPFHADVLEFNKGKFHILRDNKSYIAEIIEVKPEEKLFVIKVNNSVYSLSVRDKYDDLLKEMGIDLSAGPKLNDMKAPMPGLVLNVLVESGQTIKKGDAIVVLEAMKMENILKSPADGIVKKVHVTKGDKVEKNQVMVNFG